MKEIVIGIWLCIQGGIDYKYKKIPVWISVLGGIIGILFCVGEKRALISILYSIVPGVVLLGFSWITKEVMGYGDGIVLLVLGLFLPLKNILSIGIIAFTLAGMVALVLLVIFQKKGSYQIPFIPFLAVGYGLDYWIQIGDKVA